ncbi:MAG: tRNA (N6-isopentenyl adenosine(37)-C2)-methylthiotransferase MiaB [Verrucomicrobia bacterium]|nr:MAG: tRNA (N6-isopentenyl adenosine(37)-C2)-methylthiotransferase MiaB [Verrucomicrobiota bacterium]PYL95347.1 MAG: tRNA (N6-isopentenyl adenosine(37)-C2)-methylthiotransferase MiaB [Verrucomicrobiota bacterium]HTD02137.1 tRNA (N6-isopentenyl adenosine(37)-C2)-methylthiotransferase MiaB [Chthoniobacterales bacterium]
MPKFFIKTYGCQMNERDSEQVAHSLIARGYERADSEQEADVVLLNTCSVRDMADQKALGKMGMLGRIANERPHVVFGFLGCMAQVRGASLLKNLPHVDLVVGTQKFHRVADYVDDALERKLTRAMDDPRFSIVDVDEEPGSQSTIRHQQLAPKQATAFVSIMQGCNMHCTFCIVPQTRGAERSRPIEQIVAEVRELVSRGVKEVTLLGQIVNLYGRHEFPKIGNKSPFVQLLDAVHEIEGLQRLRFTSPHPIGFRKDLIDAYGRLPKLVDHLHLPVQSGSNRILKAMHRTYTAEKYADLVRQVRDARKGIGITTDIIVGFPGETDDDYQQTRALVEEINFDNAFVFRYSPRRDTPAAGMADQIDERIKERRNHHLLEIVNESARRINERLVGRTLEVLCEGPSKTNPSRLMGRTRTNKIVLFEGPEEFVGVLVDVRIERATGFSLYGTPVPTEKRVATIAA